MCDDSGFDNEIAQWVKIESREVRYCVEGSGIPVLLIHGVGGSLDNWNGVVEWLDGRLKTIRYDLRGHGESWRPPGPYGINDFVDDAIALLKELRIEQCVVAGHSLGGTIALALAAAQREVVSRLVVLSAPFDRTEEERARVLKRVNIISNGVPGEHFERSLTRWFTEKFIAENADFIARYAEQNKRNDAACYAAAYRVLAETELVGRVGSVRAPTLIATGEEDIGSNPAMAYRLGEELGDSEVNILPGLRHSILLEAPAVVGKLIEEFSLRRSNKG